MQSRKSGLRTIDVARRAGYSVQQVRDLERDGGLVRVDEALVARAVTIADTEGLSVYDAGYVAGAASIGARLVSCDLRDLVSAISP